MFDRLSYSLNKSWLGDRQPNQITRFGSYIEASLARGVKYAAERLRQFAELVDRLIEITAFANPHLDAGAADDKSGVADPRVAQYAADVIAQNLEQMDECIERRRQVEPEIRAWLTGARPPAK